jgi:hypothetical protein
MGIGLRGSGLPSLVPSNNEPEIKDEYVANSRYGPTRAPGKYSLNTIYESQEEQKGGSPHEKPKNSSNEGNFVMRIFVCHLSRSCVWRVLVRVSGYSKRSARGRIEKKAHLNRPPAVPDVPRKRRQFHDKYHLRASDIV